MTQSIPYYILTAIAVLISLTVHEYSHGLAAYKLGDTTARDMGRLTLNPIKHIDPIGALLLYQQAKLAAKELRPLYEKYSDRYTKGTDDVPPEKGLPMNLSTDMLMRALGAVVRRLKVAQSERNATELVNPLIKHKVVSVEEKIIEICALLEDRPQASLFFLLKDAPDRAELVARFMGVLELIKTGRVLITTATVIDDQVEYYENGLEMMLRLNPYYIPAEGEASEFDASGEEDNEKDGEEKADGKK